MLILEYILVSYIVRERGLSLPDDLIRVGKLVCKPKSI